MAWQAKLAAPVEKRIDTAGITVIITYHDTADPDAPLHAKTFQFKPAATGAEIQAEIIREGQIARAAYTRAASINTSFPVGTTLNIP